MSRRRPRTISFSRELVYEISFLVRLLRAQRSRRIFHGAEDALLQRLEWRDGDFVAQLVKLGIGRAHAAASFVLYDARVPIHRIHLHLSRHHVRHFQFEGVILLRHRWVSIPNSSSSSLSCRWERLLDLFYADRSLRSWVNAWFIKRLIVLLIRANRNIIRGFMGLKLPVETLISSWRRW